MKHKIGIIGLGFVGTAVETGMQNIAEVRVYDKYKDTENLKTVVDNSEILFLCLPTPMNEDGSCDTSIIEEVALEVNKIATSRKTIVNKSTVPPGTTQRLAGKHHEHDWVFNPEFLTEANFINDFLQQDRIVLGYASNCGETGKNRIWELYEHFMYWQDKAYDSKILPIMIECKSEEAEMIKYMGNCFLATKVIFANEMHEICEAAGIDYGFVKSVVTRDDRIMDTHLNVPGPDGHKGFGLSCFPKDLNALVAFARERGAEPMLLDTVWSKNLLVREVHDWEDLAQVTGEYEKDE